MSTRPSTCQKCGLRELDRAAHAPRTRRRRSRITTGTATAKQCLRHERPDAAERRARRPRDEPDEHARRASTARKRRYARAGRLRGRLGEADVLVGDDARGAPRRRTRAMSTPTTSTTNVAASWARVVSSCGRRAPGERQAEAVRLRRQQHEREEHLHRHDDDRRVPDELAEARPVQHDGRVEDLTDAPRPQLRHHARDPNGRSASDGSRTRRDATRYSVRMIAASPWPPPPHSAAAPTPPPRRRSSLMSVSTTRVPDMPTG